MHGKLQPILIVTQSCIFLYGLVFLMAVVFYIIIRYESSIGNVDMYIVGLHWQWLCSYMGWAIMISSRGRIHIYSGIVIEFRGLCRSYHFVYFGLYTFCTHRCIFMTLYIFFGYVMMESYRVGSILSDADTHTHTNIHTLGEFLLSFIRFPRWHMISIPTDPIYGEVLLKF